LATKKTRSHTLFFEVRKDKEDQSVKTKSLIALIAFTFILIACTPNNTNLTEDFPPENFGYAAGEKNFPVSVNGVVVQVTDIQVYAGDENIIEGYVYVVPTISVTNRSKEPVLSTQFSMLDQYINEYQSWQTNVSFASSLQAMPEYINTNEVTTGQQVFIVPAATLNANMLVRWQSIIHESRIDISVGELTGQ
jgi:hypothetical protein